MHCTQSRQRGRRPREPRSEGERLAGDDALAADRRRAFLQEVRRFYPFTPFLGARVRTRFTYRDWVFEPGTLVVLDVYGNQHDPELWEDPEEFRPERFMGFEDDRFTFTPQGGGDAETGHRCAGAWITTSELDLALRVLTRDIACELEPAQDLGFALRRMPTRPRSGVVLRNVRALPREPSDALALASARASGAVASALAAVPPAHPAASSAAG